MAIDPNIPLMARGIDLGQVLTTGLQSAQSLMSMRQMMEERERQKRLQPLQEQMLQLQSMKINATADFMLAKKIEPLVASGKWDDALKLVNSDKTISDETKGLASSVLENKDTLGAISLLNSAYENGYSIGGIERPAVGKVSTKTVLDPATNELKIGRFDDQGNFLNFVEGVAPRPTTIQESSVVAKSKIDEKRINAQLLAINDLEKNGRIDADVAAGIRAIAASGDPGAVASAMQTYLTGKGITAGQWGAIVKDKGDDMTKFEALKTKAVKEAKNNVDIVNEAAKSVESFDAQIGIYKRALELVDEGADTGPIANLIKSIKDPTIELNALKNDLALKAISSIALAPWSNADVGILKDNVLPTDIDKIRPWIERKLDSLERTKQYQLQRAAYFSRNDARIDQWLNPQNWSQGTFSLIPSANRPGGADRATAIEIQRGNVPDIPFSPPPPAPGMPSQVQNGRVPEAVLNQPISGSTRTPRRVMKYDPNTFLFDDEQ